MNNDELTVQKSLTSHRDQQNPLKPGDDRNSILPPPILPNTQSVESIEKK